MWLLVCSFVNVVVVHVFQAHFLIAYFNKGKADEEYSYDQEP